VSRVLGETSISSTDNKTIGECFNGDDGAPEGFINKFLSKCDNSFLDHFHIHGWRWHTMSLVREVGRLHSLAERVGVDKSESLEDAVDYVIGFNLKGLHKIEADLFFPWMREKLTAIQQRDLSDAFATVMDQLEGDRRMVAKLGNSIKRSVAVACNTANSELIRAKAIDSIAEESSTLESYARLMMEKENTLLVPAIAQIVTESEQKSFNNKVLRSLGILDSRLHLVGMHEAVLESKNPKEQELFRHAIPSIPQMMIPRWKRKLFEPKTRVFE